MTTSDSRYDQIAALSAEAAEHRATALRLAESVDTEVLSERVLAKAQVYATLAVSCEQRVATLAQSHMPLVEEALRGQTPDMLVAG